MIRILCVDDQASNLMALEAIFLDMDYRLVCVGSGKEALDALNSQEFAVILMDVQMPVLDGFQTAKRIRALERLRTTPIIFLTANYPSEEDSAQGYEAGAVDYLIKPINMGALRAKVGVFAELYRKKVEIQAQAERLRRIEQFEQERQLEEVRRASEIKYQNLVEGIREGIVWTADPTTFRLTFLSRHAEKLTGYSIERCLSEPEFWRVFLPPEDQTWVFEAFAGIFSGNNRYGIDHQFIKASGERMWFHTEVHLDHSQGKPELQGLSVDVTHLKKTEAALREAVAIRDEFLSIASHELKTPITPLQLQMQSFIRLIETKRLGSVDPERLKAMIEVSDAQVGRLSRLIGQLLNVSQIREGRLAIECADMRLSDLVKEVLEQCRHEVEASECTVRLDLDESVEGHWDRHRIEQVLVNLLTNSTRYAAGTVIEILVRQERDRAILAVRDRGMGVDPVDHARIFERFERGVSSKNFGGMGLGLYVARQIVELHGGTISIESKIGSGATFTVRLPLVTALKNH
ncbi:MAG: ATP-binding protein [Bdellovibrionota bacterium]